MKNDNWAFAAFFSTTIMIFVMIVWFGAYGHIWRAAWTAQPADWLGFFGNIIAGFMTLCAAGVAWLAVRMQIGSDREIASRGHLQAMRAIKFMLRPVLESLEVLWGIFDETLAFEGTEEEKLSRTTWLQSSLYATPPQTVLDDLKILSPNLEKDRALLFETVIFRLSNFYKTLTQYTEQKERSDELSWRMHDIRLMRLQISLVKHAVNGFEPAWTRIFGQHRQIPLDETSYADVMKSGYASWVAEEASRRGNIGH